MAYTIGSMLWIAAAILLFPYAYTPRDDRRARLVRRALLIGVAVVFVLTFRPGSRRGVRAEMRGRRLPALALTAVLLAGCGTPPIDAADLGLSRSTMRIPLDRAADGGLATRAVMSLSLANSTDRTLEIVGIEPATDDGLEVEYIGYSSCRRGCVGTGFWTAETQAQVERGLDGTYPVPVPSNRDASEDRPPVHLVFLFKVPTDAGVAALERGCLRFLGVSVELSDGESVSVGESGDSFVAALRIEEDREGYIGCDL